VLVVDDVSCNHLLAMQRHQAIGTALASAGPAWTNEQASKRKEEAS
jgi:hypothetical protein